MSTTDKVIALIVAVAVLAGIVAWGIHRWLLPDPDDDEVGWEDDVWTPGHPSYGYDPRDEEWEQLDPDTAAAVLVSEWHDDDHEHVANTDTITRFVDDIEVLAWDAGRQEKKISELGGRTGWRWHGKSPGTPPNWSTGEQHEPSGGTSV